MVNLNDADTLGVVQQVHAAAEEWEAALVQSLPGGLPSLMARATQETVAGAPPH